MPSEQDSMLDDQSMSPGIHRMNEELKSNSSNKSIKSPLRKEPKNKISSPFRRQRTNMSNKAFEGYGLAVVQEESAGLMRLNSMKPVQSTALNYERKDNNVHLNLSNQEIKAKTSLNNEQTSQNNIKIPNTSNYQ